MTSLIHLSLYDSMRRITSKYLKTKILHLYLTLFVHPPTELFNISGYLHTLEGRYLFWLAEEVPPQGLIVEVGSFKGKSSCFLAAGLKNRARLACIDTWENDAMPYDSKYDVLSEFLKNTKKYRDVIDIYRGCSVVIAKNWDKEIDLLFIDGDHSFEGCINDCRSWLPFLKKGGWVAFHDSGEEGVSQAIAEISRNYDFSEWSYVWSITAMRKL